MSCPEDHRQLAIAGNVSCLRCGQILTLHDGVRVRAQMKFRVSYLDAAGQRQTYGFASDESSAEAVVASLKVQNFEKRSIHIERAEDRRSLKTSLQGHHTMKIDSRAFISAFTKVERSLLEGKTEIESVSEYCTVEEGDGRIIRTVTIIMRGPICIPNEIAFGK